MSDVTPRDFSDDVWGQFQAYWDTAQPTLSEYVAYPNRAFDPEEIGESDTQAWVRAVIVGNQEGGMVRYSNSVDRNHWQRNGRITFEVYVREQTSSDLAYELIDDIMFWMENPGTEFAIFSNISAPVEIGPDGTWFQVSISADWRYFTDRAA